MECCRRMKAAAMCCARSFAGQSRTGDCSGTDKPFLYQMVFAVRDLMQDAYPELKNRRPRFESCAGRGNAVSHTLLESGMLRNCEEDCEAADAAQTALDDSKTPSPGEEAFKLYDTFGMPLDFMQDAARDQGIEFDQAGFDRAMDEQRERARASWKGAAKQTANPAYQKLPKSEFEGYRQTGPTAARCWPSSTTARARRNSSRAKKAKSSSTTRRSTPSPADRWATADGSTATITTRSWPK